MVFAQLTVVTLEISGPSITFASTVPVPWAYGMHDAGRSWWQVTNNGVVHLAIAAKRLRTLRLFGTGASAGMVRDRFARPPAQTVTVDKDAWWLQRQSTEAVAVN